MRRVLPLFVLTVLCTFLLSCGGQDLELISIQATPSSPNIVGIGGTQQLTVTANYNDGRTENVTSKSTFTISVPDGAPASAPLEAVTISASGLLHVVDGACTWTNTGTVDAPAYGTNPYKLAVNYENMSTIVFVSVASAVNCDNPDTAAAK